MEGQTDLYASTLRRFVEAMSGELCVMTHFPEGNVEINQRKREPEPELAEPAAI